MVVATCLATVAVLAVAAVLVAVLLADVPLADAMQLLAAVASLTRTR
jgi:hypothetical protein